MRERERCHIIDREDQQTKGLKRKPYSLLKLLVEK
jgi:hypothetical protein